jgi:hypothetical protein
VLEQAVKIALPAVLGSDAVSDQSTICAQSTLPAMSETPLKFQQVDDERWGIWLETEAMWPGCV